MQFTLSMADGTEILVTDTGYQCAKMPSLAKVLTLIYPPYTSNRLTAQRLANRYGWRVKEAIEAIEAGIKEYEGVGV